MLSRKVTSLLLARLEEYPAAALVGPRQSGKTTLARSIGGRYYDLEQEPDQLRLDIEWEEVSSGRELVILDEAQAWPEIFPRLRGAIDENRRRNGRFPAACVAPVPPSGSLRVSAAVRGRRYLQRFRPVAQHELLDLPCRRLR